MSGSYGYHRPYAWRTFPWQSGPLASIGVAPGGAIPVHGSRAATRIGYIAPDITLAQIRQINSFAKDLDVQIVEFGDPVFRHAWDRWLEDAWRPFYETWAGPNASFYMQTLGSRFDSEGLARQTERFRQELLSWNDSWKGQRLATGAPVPQAPGSPPTPAPKPSASQSSFALDLVPWWVYVGGAAALVGGGYLLWKNKKLLLFL